MENPATGDARISGACASLCGLERALALEAAGAPEGKPEKELALARIELLYALVSSLVGIPMIFSGDELAQLNDYSFEDDAELSEDNRWMHRPLLDWEAAARRGLSGGVEARVFGWIKTCLALRKEIAAFAQDAPFRVLESPSENLLLCLRGEDPDGGPAEGPSEGSRAPVLVVANFAPEPRELSLPLAGFEPQGGCRDLLGGQAARLEGGRLSLGPYGVAWLAAAGG